MLDFMTKRGYRHFVVRSFLWICVFCLVAGRINVGFYDKKGYRHFVVWSFLMNLGLFFREKLHLKRVICMIIAFGLNWCFLLFFKISF